MLIEDFIELLDSRGLLDKRRRGLYRRLAQAIRNGVVTGQITPGSRLPPSRFLAKTLSVSRSTIMNTYEQLLSEGVIEGRPGAGTYICEATPLANPTITTLNTKFTDQTFARRARPIINETHSLDMGNNALFFPGLTDLSMFPDRSWQSISNRFKHQHLGSPLAKENLGGYPKLRTAIAEHLKIARGFTCDSNQIIIMNGLLSTARFLFNLFCDPGDTVMIEDPGYPVVMSAALLTDVQIVPLPVDQYGAAVPSTTSRMIYLTPSHQFPLGVNMPLERRLEMIDYAAANNTWIIEDDYDNEFPLTSRPIPAMKALDTQERIFYVGTFSKVLASYLRVNYLVVPKPLATAVVDASIHMSFEVPLTTQATLADYMAEGLFQRHIRRMRILYAKKKRILTKLIEREFSGIGQLRGGETGVHLVIELTDSLDDKNICQRAGALGMGCWPLSEFCIAREMRGIVLGFGHGDIRELVVGIKQLADLVKQALHLQNVVRDS